MIRKIVISFLFFFIICSSANAQRTSTSTAPTICEEEDGDPSVRCRTIKFPNNAATDNSDGTVSIKTILGHSAPASIGSTCDAGQTAYATGFLYVCVSSDSWQRVALGAWTNVMLLSGGVDKVVLSTGATDYILIRP